MGICVCVCVCVCMCICVCVLWVVWCGCCARVCCVYGVWVGIIGWVCTNAMEYMYTQFAFILKIWRTLDEQFTGFVCQILI